MAAKAVGARRPTTDRFWLADPIPTSQGAHPGGEDKLGSVRAVAFQRVAVRGPVQGAGEDTKDGWRITDNRTLPSVRNRH